MLTDEIKEHFKKLCINANHTLTRTEYRKVNTIEEYSSSKIETQWGSWKAFINEVSNTINLNRYEINKRVNKSINDIVITSVIDGSKIDYNCLDTLLAYCKKEKCKLYILWGKSLNLNGCFAKKDYELLKEYLVTDLTFEKELACKALDLLIPANSKNPLQNLDKLSKGLSTLIVGSPKQYLDTLPHDPNDKYKLALSTGTISVCKYKNNVSGNLDTQNHTLGGIRLEWNTEKKRYIPRQLQYKDKYIYDLGICYSKNGTVSKGNNVDCMVLGDLHFPETDYKALDKSIKQINYLKPKQVMIHDWMSYQSINHHDESKMLSKLLNMTDETVSLEKELNSSLLSMKCLAKACPESHFTIVYSNHDDFLMKWLNTGEFVKSDPVNRVIGCELFANIAKGKDVFDGKFAKNVSMLPFGQSMKINGFEVGRHGDAGIAGARGNINAYVKTYNKSITGHTHSPKIKESGVVVGTLSKLQLTYNRNSLSNWAHANCVLYKNGTFQLIFV